MTAEFTSNYKDTTDWRLVNDFTIYEKKQLKERPYMRTCVPKRLRVELSDVRAIEAVEWVDKNGDNETLFNKDSEKEEKLNRNPLGYQVNTYLLAKGVFKDKITIFNIERGAISQHNNFNHIRIAPLPHGQVGGQNSASVMTGIRYSGMSSKEVPENGLMQGEPGNIWWDDENDELEAYLFIDSVEFDHLFSSVKNGIDRIAEFKIDIIAELFEDELQSFASEHWMTLEYGFLKRERLSSTRARLENMSLVFSKSTAFAENSIDTLSNTESENNLTVKTNYSWSGTEKILKAIFVAIVVLIVCLLYKL